MHIGSHEHAECIFLYSSSVLCFLVFFFPADTFFISTTSAKAYGGIVVIQKKCQLAFDSDYAFDTFPAFQTPCPFPQAVGGCECIS